MGDSGFLRDIDPHMKNSVFSVALRIFFIFLFFLCFINSEVFSQGAGMQDVPQQIKDFSISGFGEKGKRSWDLAGQSADINDEVIKLNQVEGNFYTENDDIRLTADKGDFDKVKNKVFLQENVVVTTSSGTTLTTDSLNWDRKTQVLETKDRVNIERENMLTTAQGAVGQPDLNKVNLKKDVRVRIDPQDEKTREKEIVIVCDGPLEVDYDKNIATFKNNVKVNMQEAIIDSDLMEVYFSKSEKDKKDSPVFESQLMGNQIDRIVAKGNVKIIRGDNTSYSDEAVYCAFTKKITLTGKPKLVIYTTEDLSAGFNSGGGTLKPQASKTIHEEKSFSSSQEKVLVKRGGALNTKAGVKKEKAQEIPLRQEIRPAGGGESRIRVIEEALDKTSPRE